MSTLTAVDILLRTFQVSMFRNDPLTGGESAPCES